MYIHIPLPSIFDVIIKSVTFLVIFCLSTIAVNAKAVLINFDDLTYVPVYPEMPFFADTPVTDQYLSQGLLVRDGYLLPYYSSDSDPDTISPPNYLLGGNSLHFSFVGQLPTYVGMYVGSFIEEAIFLEAYGPSGLLATARTSGFSFPESTPYVPRQYITFEVEEGISHINMWGAYGSRVSAVVDDLTFTYASVPEPSSFLLLGLGALGLMCRRLKV